MSEHQAQVLRLLGKPLSERGFYLAGGTAIALYFGHRVSEDLDWFTDDALEDPLELAADIRSIAGKFELGLYEPGTLYGVVNETRISFLKFRYPRLSELLHVSDPEFAMAGLDDLACMKLAAITKRGEKKDFVDLYEMIRHHCKLRRIIELYCTKFKVSEVKTVFRSLTWFEEAEMSRMPNMIEPLEWGTVKKSIEGWTREITG